MAERAMLRVITYDIADDRRRRSVADRLEAAAVRVQESVFEARLTEAQARRLATELRRRLGPGDSLRIYAVPDGALHRCVAEGGPAIADGARYWLV